MRKVRRSRAGTQVADARSSVSSSLSRLNTAQGGETVAAAYGSIPWRPANRNSPSNMTSTVYSMRFS